MAVCKRGFTLIELLVVIGIIAVLSAILFPVFAQVREKARQTMCISNENQLSMGMQLYTEDNDDTYPMMQYGTPGGTAFTWGTVIYPYIKSGANNQSGWAIAGGVYQCPSSPRPQWNNYGIRNDIFPDEIYSGFAVPVARTSMIDEPSDKAMIFEKGLGPGSNNAAEEAVEVRQWYWNWGYGHPVNGDDDASEGWAYLDPPGSITHLDITQYDCDLPVNATFSYPECDDFPRYRHDEMSNIVFFDGHVKAIKRGQLDWFKNIYIKITDWPADNPNASPFQSDDASWYPY